MFVFRAEVPLDRQDAVLAEIRSWHTNGSVDRLTPEAKQPDLLRMCYAYLEDDADADAVVQRLLELPEIESASLPTRRRLT